MAQPNDLIVTFVRDGDDLNITRIEVIPSSGGSNVIEMRAVNEVQFNLFQSSEFEAMDDGDTGLTRCEWKPASPAEGREYDGYMDSGLEVV